MLYSPKLRRLRPPFLMDMWRHAPMMHGMIEVLLVVGVVVLVLCVFMAFVGWSSH